MTTQRMLPLYEAKMIHHFDHRWATYERDGSVRDVTVAEKSDPDFAPLPRYWVREEVVRGKLDSEDEQWMVGFRDITNSTNERTWISGAVPLSAVGNNLPILRLRSGDAVSFLASTSSFVLDFLARPKVAGVHLNFFIAEQVPVLKLGSDVQPWLPSSTREWSRERVIELTYTARSLHALAASLGEYGEPFTWDVERRFWLRAELDAAFFHLYGIERDDVDYIMDTFPIVKRKDVAAHGMYRTKGAILQVYDLMREAMADGTAYETVLDPPPGQGARHPATEQSDE